MPGGVSALLTQPIGLYTITRTVYIYSSLSCPLVNEFGKISDPDFRVASLMEHCHQEVERVNG